MLVCCVRYASCMQAIVEQHASLQRVRLVTPCTCACPSPAHPLPAFLQEDGEQSTLTLDEAQACGVRAACASAFRKVVPQRPKAGLID